ncbi:hypothetical protein GCM10027519_47930 [Kineococcus endophyticus]
MCAAASVPGGIMITEREKAMLRLVADGLTNHQIGVRLHYSDGAISRCLSELMQRWSVHNRAHLVWRALEMGALATPSQPAGR